MYCADKVVPVEGDKGAAGVAIETTVANCSRPSEPSTAVSCAVGGAAVASRLLAKPDTAWVAVKSRGAPGSCVADDPPKRRSGRPGGSVFSVDHGQDSGGRRNARAAIRMEDCVEREIAGRERWNMQRPRATHWTETDMWHWTEARFLPLFAVWDRVSGVWICPGSGV